MANAPIQAMAVRAAGEAFTQFSYDPGPLGALDVRIDISHCGICHSDVSLIDDHHGFSVFPVVAGHEIVGHVSAVGDAVQHLTVGQRVGVGPIRSACLHCPTCAHGRDNLCSKGELTVLGHHGGFAEAIQLPAAFAFALPDALASEHAAPLLCAGLTVYAPLARHAAPQQHVGILGIGGLGHLAIQIASRRGCEVTVFSTSADKEEQARRFGANHFVNVNDSAQFEAAKGSLDVLLSTTYAAVPWMQYMEFMRPNGHINCVGASMSPLDIPSGLLTLKQLTIGGSAAGSRADMMDMLEFCARQGIAPQTESMPMSKLDEAVQRVRERKARYRVVLTA